MDRSIEVTFRNMPRSEAIESVARREALKLERYAPKIVGCRVAIERPQRFQRQGNAHRVRLFISAASRGPVVVTREPLDSDMHEDLRTIVILASMVDREANNKTATDRGNVCSVYYNRLKINMTLGVDATLLYALGRLTPEPTFAELQLDSPYNTRIHAGLPPGPISNPGKAALAACINPPKTNFLFYFTDRQGTTHFETNEQDFERDKQQYGVSGS